MAKFATLYSSSSGNSAYIEEGGEVLMIDCGKNCKTTINALYSQGVAVKNIKGILITHEHTDHIFGLSVLLKHYKLPIFGHRATLDHLVREKLVPSGTVLTPVFEDRPFTVGGFLVTPFETSHDSLGAHGYRVETKDGKKLCYATDTGMVSEKLFGNLCGCDLLAIESNYDRHMLKTGRYPQFLKFRIDSDRGHLSNDDCAEMSARLAKEGVKRFVFCHLSKENNRPEKVLETISTTFAGHGIIPNDGERCVICVAPSDTPMLPIEF